MDKSNNNDPTKLEEEKTGLCNKKKQNPRECTFEIDGNDLRI